MGTSVTDIFIHGMFIDFVGKKLSFRVFKD